MPAPRTDNPPPMIFADDFVEHFNIGWRVEPGVPDPANPLVEPKYPWDSATPFVGHGTVLRDPIDGKYKSWGVAIEDEPPQGWVTGDVDASKPYAYTQHDYRMRLAYMCSDDGVNWDRPLYNDRPFGDHGKTNILFPERYAETTFASVFIDANENPDEPYEMFAFHQPERMRKWRTAEPLETIPGFESPGRGLFRYRSRDGLHWRPVSGPRHFYEDGDGLFVYRLRDGTYQLHHKIGITAFPAGIVMHDGYVGGCRTIWRRTSEDGDNWSERYPIQLPTWRDRGGDQFMDLQYHGYGGGIIAFNSIYRAVSQTQDVVFAASVDGKNWWRPSEKPVVANEPLGDVGGGMIWISRDMVEDGDQVHLYYGATEGLHGDLYARGVNQYMFYGVFCRATWQRGRMWAAVPASGGPVEARLTTPLLEGAGRELVLNAVTVRDGFIRVELLDDQMKPIPGFTRDDAVPFAGDEKHAVAAWKGGSRIDASRVHCRFIMKRARLYGYEPR